ncbi:MAG: type II toxin-antitoxin system VapC family toxin [Defluviitaleaceae bacterium]|nr:type II toxin-antitoxin system VapC family toxin [Defluviitaleaceae bacterium]
MDILLDTHAILWFLKGSEKMPKSTRAIICDPTNKKHVSIASTWEVAIKSSNGKLNFDGGIEGFVNIIDDNGFLALDIDTRHVKGVAKLPFIHRDPFDRMLIAQAIIENMHIMTVDENILKYGVNTIW